MKKKTTSVLLYSFVGFFALLFFLYLNLPRVLIKERIANILTKQTNAIVSIEDISIHFPLGVTLHELNLSQPNINKDLSLKKVYFNISFFSLFLGNINGSLRVERNDSSSFDLSFLTNVFSKNSHSNPLANFSFESKFFKVSDLLNYMIHYKKLTSNDIFFSLLAETVIEEGSLSGKISLEKMQTPKETSGQIDLKLNNFVVKHPSFNSIQKITKPIHVKANFAKESIQLTSPLHIKSQEIDLALSGSILKPLTRPNLNLELDFSISGDIKNFLYPLLASYKSQTNPDKYFISIKGSTYSPLIEKSKD